MYIVYSKNTDFYHKKLISSTVPKNKHVTNCITLLAVKRKILSMNIFTKKNILKSTISPQKPSNNVASNIWDPNIMELRKQANGMERLVRQNLWRMPYGTREHKKDISLGQMVPLVILWLVEQA